MHKYLVNPEIIREYDVRGTFTVNLTDKDAFSIGYRLGLYVVKNNKESLVKKSQPIVCVARDGRLSSPPLLEALKKGLAEANCKIVDIGVGPTPMLYFASNVYQACAGVMVTGSHNPPNDNGFKFVYHNLPLYGKQLKDILTAELIDNFYKGVNCPEDCVEYKDIQLDYVNRILKDYQGQKEFKIAWDCGNGAAGEIVKNLVTQLKGQHILLNEVIDGTFPSHHPDPSEPKNLQQLITAVKNYQCDVGFAFDGDGDRLGAVDKHGNIWSGDIILLFLAQNLLKSYPKAKVVADVKCGKHFFTGVKNAGGQALISATGHSLIKTKMLETGALLAGELSGHIFYKDQYYGFDDAIYAAVRFINSMDHINPQQWFESLEPTFSTPELRLPCTEAEKKVIINQLIAKLQADNKQFNQIDGVRYDDDRGWWVVRPSNTQSLMVIRVEADSAENLKNLINELQQLLGKNLLIPKL